MRPIGTGWRYAPVGLYLACIGAGYLVGKLSAEGIGALWAPPGAQLLEWMFRRLQSPGTSGAELAGFLLLFYGTAALGGVVAVLLGLLGRTRGWRPPSAALAVGASLLHICVFSWIHVAVGWPVVLACGTLVVSLLGLLGALLDRALGSPRGRPW